MKFRYTQYPTRDETVYPYKNSVFYPTISLTLINPKSKKVFPNYIVLIDSGASCCVFHAGIGEALGLDIKSGGQVPFQRAVAGGGKLYFHKIILGLEGNKMKSEVGFTYDLVSPFGLLGQEGFFDKFRVCFDFIKKEFEINPKRSKS